MNGMRELIYVHDPMCSWCWGFRPTLQRLRSRLPDGIAFRHLLGGLAPDSEQPMPLEMRKQLQDTWQRIQQRIPGTEFNFAFWADCKPRRSTYPACRAVLAARALGRDYEEAMILAVQQAYYTRAMNPSDAATLLQLADEIGLQRSAFAHLLTGEATCRQLEREISEARTLGANSFPSLLLESDDTYQAIAVDYTDADPMLDTIESLIA